MLRLYIHSETILFSLTWTPWASANPATTTSFQHLNFRLLWWHWCVFLLFWRDLLVSSSFSHSNRIVFLYNVRICQSTWCRYCFLFDFYHVTSVEGLTVRINIKCMHHFQYPKQNQCYFPVWLCWHSLLCCYCVIGCTTIMLCLCYCLHAVEAQKW